MIAHWKKNSRRCSWGARLASCYLSSWLGVCSWIRWSSRVTSWTVRRVWRRSKMGRQCWMLIGGRSCPEKVEKFKSKFCVLFISCLLVSAISSQIWSNFVCESDSSASSSFASFHSLSKILIPSTPQSYSTCRWVTQLPYEPQQKINFSLKRLIDYVLRDLWADILFIFSSSFARRSSRKLSHELRCDCLSRYFVL